MAMLKQRLEDSLNPNKDERRGNFFNLLMEAFREEKFELVEDVYLDKVGGFLPKRFYELAEGELKKEQNISALLKLKECYENLDSISMIKHDYFPKISDENLENMTKNLYESERYAHLRKFVDSYPEIAKPIIEKLISGYREKGDLTNSRKTSWFRPKND